MQSRVISTWLEFEQIQTQWDSLLEQSDANTLFLTWHWIDCWRKTLPTPITPHIIILEEQQQIVAIAPFYIQPYKIFRVFPFKALRVLGDQGIGSEYGNFIVNTTLSEQYKHHLWQQVCSPSNKAQWDFIWFTNIATWTKGGETLIASLQEQELISYQQRIVEFAATPLTHFTGQDEVKCHEQLLKQLSKSLRTNIKQTTKRITKDSSVEFAVTEHKEAIAQHLNLLFDLHNRRWRNTGIAGSFEKRPQLRHFYHMFAPIAFANQQLKILRLTANDTTYAIQFGYVYNNQFLAMQEGFDPDLEAGTGQILRSYAFTLCINEGLDSYDFLGGYTDHKRRWLAQKNEGKHLFIWQKKIKNTLFNTGRLWPSGRFFNAVS